MDAHTVSRCIADKFMTSFAVHSRLSSNFNTVHDTMKRSLTPLNYSADMFVPIDGQYVTIAALLIDSNEVIKNIEMAEKCDKKPEKGMHNNFSSTVDFKLVFHALACDVPFGPLRPYPVVGDSSMIAEKLIKVPVSHGCMFSISDGDGVGGMFLLSGHEYYYSQKFIDCSNNMTCNKCPNGAYRVVCVSRPLHEVSPTRDIKCVTKTHELKYTSSVHTIHVAVLPNEGVYIKASMGNRLVTEVERGNGDSRVGAFVPLVVYLEMLRWKVEGAHTTPFNTKDVDDLFEGIESMANTMIHEEDKIDFRSMVSNTKLATLAHLAPRVPNGELEKLAHESYAWLRPTPTHAPKAKKKSKAKNDKGEHAEMDQKARLQLLRAQAIREFVPHISNIETFGTLSDDPHGETKFGFIKKMVIHAFATIAGLHIPHDIGDLRAQRVKTVEMSLSTVVRANVQKYMQETLIKSWSEFEGNRRSWLEVQAKSHIQSWKPNDLFIKRMKRELDYANDTRKCFANMLQKMFMIKITTMAGVDPLKRKMHWSYAGHLCGSDTPSTAEVGLELSPNVSTLVSHDVNHRYVLEKLKPLLLTTFEAIIPVFLNGVFVGKCRDATRVRNFVRTDIRRERFDEPLRGSSHETRSHFPLLCIGVHTENRLVFHPTSRTYKWLPCVCIRTDGGRLYKPSIQLSRMHLFDPSKSIYTLIDDGVVEFMDLDEELSKDVRYSATLWDADPAYHTHCELHPTLMHGVLTSLIPHVNRNHGVKNSNMCNHFKAVMHNYSLTHATRIETLSHMAWNLQIPLMRTPAFDWLEMHLRPHGANVMLMIATHSGYNQEDAIVVKQSFIDRGGFYGTVSKTFDAKRGLTSTMVRKTKVAVGGRFEADMPLATFTSPKNETEIRSGLQDHGRVDYILSTDARFALRSYRSEIPRVGDKFASSHAQKGTIGQIVSEMDLPYTEEGLTPDILLNPHAIPSRTTTAQPVEMLYGILAAASGQRMCEYAFDELPLKTVEELLEKAGIKERGLVSLIDPLTGCRIKAKVYMGIGYYCRLKHIVNDKVRSQDIMGGERCALTKQPASGRKKRGGVRLNEMERWAMIGHGGSHTINDCFTKLSDGTTITVNGSTGKNIDAPNDATPGMRSFESNYTVQKLQQTLQAAMIGLSFETKPAGGIKVVTN